MPDFKTLGDLVWEKDAERSLRATFSRFHVVDHDGDVTLPSAFADGQPVPMVWAHDWEKPVGKGKIEVLPDRAVFAGAFFDTAAGLEAYKTVKAMGELQQYSYGYRPLDAEPGTLDGAPVRYLKSVQVFEVSPVLVGAGIGTGTDRIKQAAPPAPATTDPTERYVEQAGRVLADLGDLRDRSRAIQALRLEQGRTPCSGKQRAALTALLAALTASRGDIEELLRTPDLVPELEALRASFARLHPGGS